MTKLRSSDTQNYRIIISIATGKKGKRLKRRNNEEILKVQFKETVQSMTLDLKHFI